jgi:glutathione S-transferase
MNISATNPASRDVTIYSVAACQAVLSHDAVKATSLPPDHYIKLYADYALGFANGAIPPGHDRSALDPDWPIEQRQLPARRVC